ncbi:MAG TPA: superoxide dismutase, partial [Bacteroidales bacterium]|nr:superoxide dismutase [Bacteroidales bacterium]
DVWEHAYYIDKLNRRPAYLESFWLIVDWEKVVERL